MSMKATVMNARADKAGKHNDRNFDLDCAKHINQDLTKENLYWTYNGRMDKTFIELERDFYEENFSDYINEQNEKNNAARHKERNRTIDYYLHSINTRPEDVILQIGNKNKHATKEELWACTMEYQKRFDRIFGSKCKILDMALHMDEATPHVHVRRVWIAEDENGMKSVSQTQALSQMGITAVDSSKETGRKNNAKMGFTCTDRRLFEMICEEKGLDIDVSNREKREHLSVEEYKEKMIEEKIRMIDEKSIKLEQTRSKIEELENDVEKIAEDLFQVFENNPLFSNLFSVELEEIRKKEKYEKLQVLVKLLDKVTREYYRENNFQIRIEKAIFEKKNERVEEFIRRNGLEDKYKKEITSYQGQIME